MKKLTLLLAALLLVIAACGDDGAPFTAPATTATTAAETTTTTDDDDAGTTLAPSTTGTTQPPETTVVPDADPLAAAIADCENGDDVACDVAYMVSEFGSDEEAIAENCGGRGLPADQVFCSGYDFDSTADAPGDDPLLDSLWDLCSNGWEDACLALWEWAPEGSVYEAMAEDYAFSDDPGDNGGDPLGLGDLPPIDVAAMNSCDEIADGAIVMFQAFIDIIDALEMEQLQQITGDEDIFLQAEDIGLQMEDRAAGLGCSDEEVETLILARTDQLTATSVFGQMIIDGIMEEGGLDFGG